MWEDVERQESFSVSAGFELTNLKLLVQEHNYSSNTHTPWNDRIAATDSGWPFKKLCATYMGSIVKL